MHVSQSHAKAPVLDVLARYQCKPEVHEKLSVARSVIMTVLNRCFHLISLLCTLSRTCNNAMHTIPIVTMDFHSIHEGKF